MRPLPRKENKILPNRATYLPTYLPTYLWQQKLHAMEIKAKYTPLVIIGLSYFSFLILNVISLSQMLNFT